MAEIKPYYDTNRKKLADIIPLPAPFTVYIEQTKYCNFKCFYCIHSTRDDENGEFQKLGHKVMHMESSYFRKIISDLQAFPKGSVKRIVFSGLGEPLMNPDLPQYVKLAAEAGICDRIEVITNGLLLTPEKADALVAAGITNINISIQGLNGLEYKETCGQEIDFTKFVDNLTYLYKNRKNVKIYIKIIDAILKSEEDKEKFFTIFGEIADRIYVEHLIVMQQQMDNLKEVVDGSLNFYGEALDANRKVCAQAFYFLQVGCDGDTFPCPVPGLGKGLSMGNAKKESLLSIWHGEKRKRILRMMLEKNKDKIKECNGCTCFNCINDPSENLDVDADKLLPLFQ